MSDTLKAIRGGYYGLDKKNMERLCKVAIR